MTCFFSELLTEGVLECLLMWNIEWVVPGYHSVIHWISRRQFAVTLTHWKHLWWSPAASKCRLRKVASVCFQENILFDSFSGESWLQISCLHWGLDMRVCGLLILSASPVLDLPVAQRVPCLSPCNSWDQPSVIPLDKHLHKTGWMDLYSVCSTKGYNKIFMKPIYQLNSLSLVFLAIVLEY